jgi:transcriptional antiterminator NusG
MHWYVVQALSGQENKIKKAIEENRENGGMVEVIETVLVPTENVAEVKKGQQHIVERKLWPGYILVKMLLTEESWQYVKNTNGVIDFLGSGSPTPLSNHEVDQLIADLSKKKDEVAYKHDIRQGDHVKIIDGVFANFTGTVVNIAHDKGRLDVVVSIFGRDTRVDDLQFWQVEKSSTEEQH